MIGSRDNFKMMNSQAAAFAKDKIKDKRFKN